MGFSMIVPTPKAKTGTFKISTVSMRGGPFRLQISIPSALFTLLFRTFEQFDLMIGEGSDKGKMMIKPSHTGHFKPTFMKHAVIFRLPEMAGTPQIALTAEDPKRREVEGGAIVIDLPDWMDEERWKAILRARQQVSRERETEKLRGAVK
ncbi:hypothetical protein RLPCCGM1_c1292 [Rhizobium leguminosarum bv. phaseoli CCGM1]|uniref:hypothetical protein n=1 Tax=Rhizobium phaseoli TaxID=396 RepID=UPI0004D929BC|nr:hypothetical protein [Rhizobium phaseoli]KEC73176.1 hypothetical protein RLPCCGM1_c1292 [Rhizobium leguminosarum bv. phaseoli CCGM1]PWI54145.1 hypothetical protein B5K03_11935 [Rhizobium phaseoli]